MTEVRPAKPFDEPSIRQTHLNAFGAAEGGTIANLASELLQHSSSPPVLNLVAEKSGRIVGHVAFSPIYPNDSVSLCGYILAPLAVDPDEQKTGIGSQLVRRGIETLRNQEIRTLLVYGDPAYYCRFGFSPEIAAYHRAPFPLSYPHGWLGLSLGNHSQPKSEISFDCVPPLRKAELW